MLVDMQEDSLQELSETELSEKNMKIFLSTDNEDKTTRFILSTS